jgi:hypothetical protein
MIIATQNRHTHWRTTSLAVAALVAVMFIVGAPYLTKNHRHCNFVGDAHCALCLFASARMEAARVPSELNGPLVPIGKLVADDESSRTLLLSHPHDARAPPVV